MLKNTYFFIDTRIISVFLSLCQPVYAALISQDYSTHGDNGLTLDTQSGLYWLDFGYTRGLSIEQVQAGSGGWNQQFRYATLPEVQLLFVHAGLNASDSFQSGDTGPKTRFENLFDTDNTACPSTLACDLFPHEGRTLSLRVGLLSGRGFANILNYVDSRLSYANPQYGSLLVRLHPVRVPEPAVTGLGFCIGWVLRVLLLSVGKNLIRQKVRTLNRAAATKSVRVIHRNKI